MPSQHRRRQESVSASDYSPMVGGEGTALQAWRDARAQAKHRLSKDVKPKVVHHRDGTTSTRYPVKADALNKLARQIYQSQQSKEKFGHSPKPKGSYQSPKERNLRRHGLTTRDLHKPVTRAEAIKLFLEGYARQAAEGHQVNPTGKRRYPSSGAVADRMEAADRRAGRPSRLGGVVEQRVKKDFVHPSQALRSRMRRTAGSPTRSVTPKRGKAYTAVAVGPKGKTNRRLIRACPDGTRTAAQAKAANCSDSWRLRENRGWKNYQVEDVSYFSDNSSARSSPLYRQAKKLASTAPRKERSVEHLKPYWRKKGQSRDAHLSRIAKIPKTRAVAVVDSTTEDTEL